MEQSEHNCGSNEPEPQQQINGNDGTGVHPPMSSPGKDANGLGYIPYYANGGLEDDISTVEGYLSPSVTYRRPKDKYWNTARVVGKVYSRIPIRGHVRREADDDEAVDDGLDAENELRHPHPLG